MAAFLNANGLLVRFGRDQGARGVHTAVTNALGKTQDLVCTVDLAGVARTLYSTDRNNDLVLDGFSGLDTPIPSGAKITQVDVLILTTPVGGTSFSVGTFTLAGAAINATGILAAGGTATVGANGALIGTQIAQDSYIGVNTLGTYTAGRIRVSIKYMIA